MFFIVKIHWEPYCRPIYIYIYIYITKNKRTHWAEFASEVCGPSDRSLSAKLVPTFANKGVSCSQRGGSPMAVFSVF
jgi:hypothetical protein